MINFSNELNLEAFHSRHNLIWNKFPKNWYDGAFLGNGVFGASIYHNEESNMILKLGHTEITDNRKNTYNNDNPLFDRARLPIGYFTIKSKSKCVECSETLDIFKAEFDGNISTENGSFKFSAITPKNHNVLIFDYETKNETIQIDFTPFPAISPRQANMQNAGDKKRVSTNYEPPKNAESIETDGVKVHIQPFFNGGYFSTCYKTSKIDENKFRFICGVFTDDKKDDLISICLNELNNAYENYDSIIKEHKTWWRDFHNKSILTINDSYWESFYHIQMYKLACTIKEDGTVPDTCGVWLYEHTGWPGVWWNLNTQLTYSPLYTSNHTDIAHSLTKMLHDNMEDLKNNVPEKYRKNCFSMGRATSKNLFSPVILPGEKGESGKKELGNLPWALFYCMQEYYCTNNKTILTETVYPILKGAMQLYIYCLKEDERGILHLPETPSPEYYESNGGDTNYDLALIRWGLKTLLEITAILNIKDEKESDWRYTLEHLAEYPHDDKDGFYISAKTKYDESHRHYSHLLMFYPLNLLNLENEKERELAIKTLKFWQSKDEALQGYSQTGASSMYSLLGDGNKALYHLEKLREGFITPNTFYKEGNNPVLETPLSAATSILDMILQSENGIINILPAIPEKWSEISFDNMLTKGGFLVSAHCKNGRIQWLKIKNLYGNECKIKVRLPENIFANKPIEKIKNNIFNIKIIKDEEIIISINENAVLNCAKQNKEMHFGLN